MMRNLGPINFECTTTTRDSDAGLPVRMGMPKDEVMEAINYSAGDILGKCKALCTHVAHECSQKITPIQKDLLEQKGSIEVHRVCLEEWEGRANKWKGDTDALDLKLDNAIQVMVEHMSNLNVGDLRAEVRHLEQKF